jgi:hypothetical protein
MSLFERYSSRARRAIYWAHCFAVNENAPEITPEHILRGILREDSDLFTIVAPDIPGVAVQIERKLASGPVKPGARDRVESPSLSELAKVVVAGAGREQLRLGQKPIATQHLLLALVRSYEKPRGWSIRRKFYEPSRAQRVLLDLGITATTIEAKIRVGIVTPTTVFDDPLIKLNAQLAAIAELLISKGLILRSEFVALLDRNNDPLAAATFAATLLDALVQKGKIMAVEKAQVIDSTSCPAATAHAESPPKGQA